MYLTRADDSQFIVLDIETDGLNPTQIWCACAKILKSSEIYKLVGHDAIRSFIQANKNKYFIGHNLLSFDAYWCNRILGTSICIDQCVDSLVLSYLYDPKMPDGHSLEAWGERLGYSKGNYSGDFSAYTEEMLLYCERDVLLTEKMYLALSSRMKARGFSEKSCGLEHEIRAVVNKQQRNGFFFDIPRATSLLEELRLRQADLAAPIQRLFPPALVKVAERKFRTNQDGSVNKVSQSTWDKYPKVTRVGDILYCYDWKEFNLGSAPQRVEKLYELGWDPENMGAKRTKSGKSWQADEDALLRFQDQCDPAHHDEVNALANWMTVYGRANAIESWLNVVDYSDSCIHGTVYTCGARSRRMTHTKPNTANIPKASKKVQYGRESRGLWRARPGRVLVGYDAKSLEMLTFCHYLNDPEVTKLYVTGDPHQRNADAWSLNPWGMPVDRNGPPGAKTGFYAGLYGAHDPKLGSSIWVGGTADMGAWARDTLYKITPGLPEIIAVIKSEYKNNGGFLSTVDGGFVRCKKESAGLNYKCQSAGGLVMKQASIFIDRRARHLDHLKVGDIHDEGQHDCDPKDAEEFGRIAVQSIRDAGEELNFNVPLDGDFKVGETWADTH